MVKSDQLYKDHFAANTSNFWKLLYQNSMTNHLHFATLDHRQERLSRHKSDKSTVRTDVYYLKYNKKHQ